jgi:uncharacterized protein YegP (UPF0339 family)
MKRQTQIEVYPGRHDNEWYWRLRHKNGRIMCDGSEAYYSASNAKRGARRTAGTLLISSIVSVVAKYGKGGNGG